LGVVGGLFFLLPFVTTLQSPSDIRSFWFQEREINKFFLRNKFFSGRRSHPPIPSPRQRHPASKTKEERRDSEKIIIIHQIYANITGIAPDARSYFFF
jgi:hypothetical protein